MLNALHVLFFCSHTGRTGLTTLRTSFSPRWELVSPSSSIMISAVPFLLSLRCLESDPVSGKSIFECCTLSVGVSQQNFPLCEFTVINLLWINATCMFEYPSGLATQTHRFRVNVVMHYHTGPAHTSSFPPTCHTQSTGIYVVLSHHPPPP